MVLSAMLLLFAAAPALVYAQEPDKTDVQPETASAQITEQETKDEELIKEVLTALADPEYETLYSALQGGAVITRGMVGENSRILQKLLVELGCDITVDSSAGPGTFGALNQVRSSFGMADTEKVDAAVLTELLPLLLLARDTDGAYTELLQSYYEEGGTGEEGSRYLYLQGCAYYMTEKYYHAMEAFQESGYSDYEERAAACEQPWPSDGELWHNTDVSGSEMNLVFDVYSDNKAKARCFEVYTQDGTKAAVLFLTGSGKVSTWLPGGSYRIKDAAGDVWYGLQDIFGRNGRYEYMSFHEFEEDEYLTRLDAGYEWTITVNAEQGNPEAAGVGSIDTDWDTWIGN